MFPFGCLYCFIENHTKESKNYYICVTNRRRLYVLHWDGIFVYASVFLIGFGNYWKDFVFLRHQFKCGNSSVGRASASQAEGRGSESRFPLFFRMIYTGIRSPFFPHFCFLCIRLHYFMLSVCVSLQRFRFPAAWHSGSCSPVLVPA